MIKEAAVDSTPLILEIKKSIYNNDEVVGDSELLKAVKDKADEIILDAQKHADEILKFAEIKSQEIFEKARQDGYQEGIKKAELEGNQIREKAIQVLQQVEAERKEILEHLRYEIISLSKEIAEKILDAQLELNPDIIIKTALKAIKLVRDRERVIFYVNSEELGTYIAYKHQLEQVLSDRAEISFIADANIKKGGCMISTENGLVDATIDERWKEVLNVIGAKMTEKRQNQKDSGEKG